MFFIQKKFYLTSWLLIFQCLGPTIQAFTTRIPRVSCTRSKAAPWSQSYKTAFDTQLSSVQRRDLFLASPILAWGLSGAPAHAARATEPLVDLPMIRLKLPQQGFGREYVAIQLKIGGEGPYDFMIDSGLTTEMITPHLQEVLKIDVGSKTIDGLTAGGGKTGALVDLNGASLCCGSGKHSELKLPQLHAVITDFPQEHIDPNHDVEGMIGMELLSLFDVDFDFPNNRIRFWTPGTVDTTGLDEISAVEINETGLIGIRLSVPGAKQPIIAFLDCGATFSCINWKAAALFGLPPKGDTFYKSKPAIGALGIDGKMMTLPVVEQKLTFTGEIERDPTTGIASGFAPPPADWTPWDPVQMAVGDIPAFTTLLGDGITPFNGPAALIGLDVLAQRRVVLEAARDSSRRRRVFVSPTTTA